MACSHVRLHESFRSFRVRSYAWDRRFGRCNYPSSSPGMPIRPILRHFAAATFASVSAFAQQQGTPAQQPVPPPAQMTGDIRSAVVDTVAAELIRFYAVADTGQLIADHLRERLAAGAYDNLTDPRLFAEAVGADMRAINHDKHLALLIGPAGFGLGMARIPQPQPANGPTPPNYPPAVLEAARRSNFGLGRVEVLPGNVGYLQINGFPGVLGPAQEAIVNGLRYLAGTDAVILDFREHGGGSGALSNFLISHFVGDDTVHVLDVEVRSGGRKTSRYTLAQVPGPRRPTVPVFILVGRGTVSAGEDFAFVMKNLGRATLVGEPTAGAGRNNPSFDAGHGFAASISVSRVSDPKTGAEWEGVGVVPNVRTPVRAALSEAHQLALTALAEKETNPTRKHEYELAKEYAAAQAKPHKVALQVLTGYEGRYGEQRVVTVEEGKLIYRVDATRPGIEMVALNDSVFAVSAAGRIGFERDPKSGYRMVNRPLVGTPLVFERKGPPPKIPSEYQIESGKPE